MEKDENILELYKVIKKENDELVKENKILHDELSFYQSKGDAYVHYKVFNDIVKDLEKLRNEYKNKLRDITLLKARYENEYKKELKNIIDSM